MGGWAFLLLQLLLARSFVHMERRAVLEYKEGHQMGVTLLRVDVMKDENVMALSIRTLTPLKEI